ncbi:MAG: aminotransferase class V-fold PLP-dependent enzyme [Cyanobacteria bacterium SZAS LIN-3]|nr:aminotransferase class V-fold PLP-dependent enzyme [Cyanobacteria bacterium SZAS LIN-3]
MQSTPIYFDNAATSFPKPEAVYLACDMALRTMGNPGRGAHQMALNAARVMFEGREALGAFLKLPSERLAFTNGCTASINLVLNGLIGCGRLESGDTILCSSFEHNAVMRPLQWLAEHRGVRIVKVAPAAGNSGIFDGDSFERLVAECAPKLCVLTLASNVTGAVLDLGLANSLCLSHGIPLLIDGAQGSGTLALDLSQYGGIAFFAASAHKGLLGPAGLGFLYVAEGQNLDPLYCGGTGSRSESLQMPQFMPDRLEPGSPAVHLVAGLTAALAYLEQHGAALRLHESALGDYFEGKLQKLAGIKVHGRAAHGQFLPTFALSLEGLGADVAADRLDQKYNIAVRPGLHCAVSAHETLGTASGGLVRVSFGYANQIAEIDLLCQALSELLS